ncbi:hypothetical protein OUZ56_010305 [Daphnia magna]|uniref:Uncharacterized protein n=1 Tax=Daphnia magna TaxID=35525 RepID=A0ABR0AI73_9CRUS|nr:hypothetical protein OUZ56_010305 [Daphnia magna]
MSNTVHQMNLPYSHITITSQQNMLDVYVVSMSDCHSYSRRIDKPLQQSLCIGSKRQFNCNGSHQTSSRYQDFQLALATVTIELWKPIALTHSKNDQRYIAPHTKTRGGQSKSWVPLLQSANNTNHHHTLLPTISDVPLDTKPVGNSPTLRENGTEQPLNGPSRPVAVSSLCAE